MKDKVTTIAHQSEVSYDIATGEDYVTLIVHQSNPSNVGQLLEELGGPFDLEVTWDSHLLMITITEE